MQDGEKRLLGQNKEALAVTTRYNVECDKCRKPILSGEQCWIVTRLGISNGARYYDCRLCLDCLKKY